MVKLFGDYVIDADSNQYILCNGVEEVTDKNGKKRTVRKVIGYYSSIEGCLKALAGKMIRDKIAEPGEIEIADLREEVRKINKKIEGLGL